LKSVSTWEMKPTVKIIFYSAPNRPLVGLMVSSSLSHSTWKMAVFLIVFLMCRA